MEARDRLPTIPGLHVLEKLGTGAVGSVYLARDDRLGKLVAVKVLRRELAGNRLYIERLRREANLSMRLNHPNIVKGIDLGEVDGALFFVMEFVDGKSLKTVLRERGRVEEEEVLEFGLQVARALDHAYRNGVVHRDIKPGNLLVSPDGTLKLADLGLARRPDDSSVTRDGVTLGTPHYISPEQALDPSRADVRSDLYSLGATLFHAATGRPPFESETVAGVLSQVLEPSQIPHIPDDVAISKNLQLVLRRLLAKDANRRYQTPDELLRDLERVRRREKPHVSIFDISPKAGKRLRAGLLGAAGLAAAGVLVFFAFNSMAGKDKGPSEAEKQLAAKVNEIEKGESDPLALAERRKRIEALLQIPNLPAHLRVRAVDVRSRIDEQISSAVGTLERSCEQELEAALSEYRFADANDLSEHSFESRFGGLFGGGFDSIPEGVTARMQQFIEKKRGEVDTAISRAENTLAEEIPLFLTKLESDATALASRGRYKTAIENLDLAIGNLAIEDGPAWKKLPAQNKDRLAERAKPKLDELRAAVRGAAREAGLRIASRLQREHDRIEESLRSGFGTTTALEFDDLANATFSETNFQRDEWPQQAGPDPSKLRDDLASSLRSLERERSRTEAERAFSEVDGKLAARLRERQYSTARDEWQSRLDRAVYTPVRDRMARRIEICNSLLEMRAAVRKHYESQIGKRVTLTLKSGEAVSGKLASLESGDDDVVLRFADGNILQVQFSALSGSDVERAAGFGDKPKDRFARGLFLLAEGELDRAQAEFAGVRARAKEDPDLASRAGLALADVDALRIVGKGEPGAREGRFEEAKRKARAFAAIGEWDLAREWYANARREGAGFQAGDRKLTELDAEIQQFENAVREQKKAQLWAEAFAGAQVRDLGEARLELLYSLRDGHRPPALDPGPDWSAGDGLSFAPKNLGFQEIQKIPGVKMALGAIVREPARVQLRVSVPFDSPEPDEPIRVFLAFGKTLVFANGRARRTSWCGVRAGNFEGIEAELGRVAADGTPKPMLGLLRGGTHQIAFAIEADGRTGTASLDGVTIAKIEGAAPGDAFEFRSNAPVRIDDLRIEGRITPKK